MNEDKAARYQRLRRRALVAAAAWTFILLVALLSSGAAAALRDVAQASAAAFPVSGWLRALVSVVVFVTILFGAHEAGALPAAFYGGYLLERRYGLSRQTAGSWLGDHAKAAAVGWLVVVAAGSVVVGCLHAWPRHWWIGAWAAAMAGSVAAAWVAPVFILPLFFRFSPLPQEPLRRRLADLAARAGVPVVGVFEWRLSDKTPRANAALAGLGGTRRILVSDTLVSDFSEDEVEVVLAHELSHQVHHDLWRALAVEAAVAAVAFWCAGVWLPRLVGMFGLAGPADLAALPAVALAVMLVSAASVPLANAAARSSERRADRVALELTNKPEAFASAIRRLAARNLAEEEPSWLVRMLFSTHPPVRQRLELARTWSARTDGA